MTKKKKTRINRTFKSTVFIMLFEDKRNLLELYNAMTGKDYRDPEQLEINTLENAIYMSMKNDVSFIIDGRLSLYEHQSTYSPNLPLRFLFYVSDLYSAFTQDKLEAVDAAIEECLRNGVLQEFLEKNRGEAMKVSIYEYDAEKHMKMEREEFWEKGRQEGKED